MGNLQIIAFWFILILHSVLTFFWKWGCMSSMVRQQEAYLLRLTGLEGIFEDFHSS